MKFKFQHNLKPRKLTTESATGLQSKFAKMSRNNRQVVLHVVESYGAGVAVAIQDYVRNTPEFDHYLYYATRGDAPISKAELSIFARHAQMPTGHFSRVRRLRSLIRFINIPLIVHAHSSFAGAYVRLALRKTRNLRIVYTPHCFSFERRDVSYVRRMTFWLMEALFSVNTTTYAACSQREAMLCGFMPRHRNIVNVPNVAVIENTAAERCSREPRRISRRILIIGVGRLTAQKDPIFFANAVAELRKSAVEVDATWVGGVQSSETDPRASRFRVELEHAGVRVLEWTSRGEALARLVSADLYLHTARWEGFPVTILEAMAAGVPSAVRAAPSLKGIPGVWWLRSPRDLVAVVEELRQNTWHDKFKIDRQALLDSHSAKRQRRQLLQAYGYNEKK